VLRLGGIPALHRAPCREINFLSLRAYSRRFPAYLDSLLIMAKSGSSKLWLVIALIVAIGGGYYYYTKRNTTPPAKFITAAVARNDIIQSVTATGDLQPVTTVEISSQISGLIQEVLVDFNSQVKKGDLLARIDPATYEVRLNSAKAQLANTRANHSLVKLNTERTRSLHSRQLVSQQELDQAEAQLTQAEAQLQIQQASVKTAEVDLARCNLYAPIDGIVMDRLAEVGKTVAASLNAPKLFTLVEDLRRMQIEAAVSEADIGSVVEGMPVNFTVDAYPDRRFRGSVRQIRNTPVREQNVITYTTIIDVNNDDLRLKPGMTANVAIVIQERKNVLSIPNSALRARIPAELLVPAPTPPPAVVGEATPEQNLTALLAELGHTGGRPNPVLMQRVRALAEERGVILPPPRGGAGSGNSVITRTVYRITNSAESPLADAVTARFGITDGLVTEVIDGLTEGEVIATGVLAPAEASPLGASSPFGPPRRR
jgi:HlyD family secretion protein